MNKTADTRLEKLLNLLITNDTPITIDKLSLNLGVSNRCVRNDLEKLELYLTNLKEDVRLIKKPRVGIWIEYSKDGLKKLKSIRNISDIYIEPYSSEERRRFIIKKLVQSTEPISMQFLADELFVSRVTIHKDLNCVEEWFQKYSLTLVKKQNYGIEIQGDEKNWRKAAIDLLVDLKKGQEIKDILSQSLEYLPNSRLNQHDINHIKELIPHIEILTIEKIITEAEKKLKYTLSDEAFTGLLIHIAISIERLKQAKDIKMDSKWLKDLKTHDEYEIASTIGLQLGKELHITIPESEIGYITLHILGAQLLEPVDIGDNKDTLIKNIEPEIISLTKDIIQLTGNILSVSLQNDNNLLVGLALHLRTTVKRLQYGLSMRNPLLGNIKENFPSIFGASWATSIIFEKHFGIRITEEEIGYIALHIGAALERLNEKTKAIVVCATGVGTSQLVVSRLEKRIKDLEIVGVSSYHDIQKYDTTEFDIIISTIPMRHDLKPVVKINVFVDDQDISAINTYIKNFNYASKFGNTIKNNHNHIFSKDLIYTNCVYKDKKDLIKNIGQNLLDKGYIKKSFIQTAIKREQITSTAVGKGVAIPHGKESLVITPVIAVAILQNPIDWGDELVDIVFFLALQFENAQDTKSFFKKFYSLLDNHAKLEEIRSTNNKEDLYQLLIDI
ncbi:PRD domain-containing protein [Alkalibaculum sp. M08DMB]|uniref:PRD domain-containing protein n=1 Tax=Alkalibaculum sporogenes TaxID=2655001 RepID=A0A6A7K848_9FIRM|nr:BglG family transcription antiterminator [Alkalibaculum sporogenes]MPW25669.1 PRD domain-containing protein [Alkalibaculum sporogenes]